MLPSSGFLRSSPSFDAVFPDYLRHGKLNSHLQKCKRNEMRSASSLTKLRNVPFSKPRCKLLIFFQQGQRFHKGDFQAKLSNNCPLARLDKVYNISKLMLKWRREETGNGTLCDAFTESALHLIACFPGCTLSDLKKLRCSFALTVTFVRTNIVRNIHVFKRVFFLLSSHHF